MEKPKELLLNYTGPMDWKSASTSFWIENNSTGDSVYINWFVSGWVCCYQESFLTKAGVFKHKDDIPGFKYSNTPGAEFEHIFSSKEEALDVYRKNIKRSVFAEISWEVDENITELSIKRNKLPLNDFEGRRILEVKIKNEEKIKKEFLERAKTIVKSLKDGDKIRATNLQNHHYDGKYMKIESSDGSKFTMWNDLRGSMIVETHMLLKLELK